MTKISQLSDIGGNLAPDDEFVIRDVSDASTPNKKVTASGFFLVGAALGIVGGDRIVAGSAASGTQIKVYASGISGYAETTISGIPSARTTISGYFENASGVASGVFYPVVTQVDIGTAANEVPLNGMLGGMAFQDPASVNLDSIKGSVYFDNSGRLLVGTSSTLLTGSRNAAIQIAGSSADTASLVLRRDEVTTGAPQFVFGKSRSASIGGSTSVQSGDSLGLILFAGADGTDTETLGAFIAAEVDGTPGTNDMPGRIVLATTADGASSPTEQLRITNDGVRGYNQAAPVAVNATATLTVANLKNGIITSTTAAAVTGTLPTGTLTEGGFSSLYDNFTFEWTVINTGATNSFTVAAGTAHTVVGNMVVAAGNSGRFATRRTAANTFVTYRLSS